MTQEVSAITKFTALVKDYFSPREELEYKREIKEILHKTRNNQVAIEEIRILTEATFLPGVESDFQREARRILSPAMEQRFEVAA